MHIDLNSCFATIEQQANPLLRGKPLGVAAYNKSAGVILAASIEAKKLGIKTGTRVFEAKQVCPDIIITEPDAKKYRHVHHAFAKLLNDYTSEVAPKSVDEFILDFKNTPRYGEGLIEIGSEIKQRIKNEIGDYITVSIGVSKNPFLAKTASNLIKPDGLVEINEHNHLGVYEKLDLIDLTGIGQQNMIRLNSHGIFTPLEFYHANPHKLKAVFNSIHGYFWYLNLRGYEIGNYKPVRRTFSHQYALQKPMTDLAEMAPVITKLVEKLGFRLRNNGYKAQGVNIALRFKNNKKYSYWHTGKKTKRVLYDSRDIYKEILTLFRKAPKGNITLVNVGVFNLSKKRNLQLELFKDAHKNEKLVEAMDKINNRWGRFVLTPGTMANTDNYVPNRIGFGNVEP